MATEHELQIPYYEQWLGPWAMLPDAFLQTFDLFRKLDLHLHLDAQQAAGRPGPATLTQQAGEIAVIDLTGKLMKQSASMGGGTSTVQARREIRAAAGSEKVSAILLRIDSPGGTAAGTQELANEIAAAGKAKPVWAYVEDMAASAAYWAASQADKIIANATAIVGSIGTYGVVQDLSGAAAMQGVKVHVVRAGAHKGAGTPGTEITPEQLADMQRIVDGLNEHFLAGVAGGRAMTLDRVRELADGRAHLAADAKTMGLIDGIGSFDQTLTKMQSIIQRRTGNMQASLSETAVDAALTVELTAPPAPVVVTETPQPKAASYAEIVAACVGCDPSFICGQLAAGVTVAAAQSAWMAEQNERIKAAIAKPGVEPIGTKPSAAGNQSGDVVSDWEAAVETFTAKGKTKQQAILAADRKFPGLREAMLAQVNQ